MMSLMHMDFRGAEKTSNGSVGGNDEKHFRPLNRLIGFPFVIWNGSAPALAPVSSKS